MAFGFGPSNDGGNFQHFNVKVGQGQVEEDAAAAAEEAVLLGHLRVLPNADAQHVGLQPLADAHLLGLAGSSDQMQMHRNHYFHRKY